VSTPLEQWVESVARMTRPIRLSGVTGPRREPASSSSWFARAIHWPLNAKTYPNVFFTGATDRRGAHGKNHLHLLAEKETPVRPITGCLRPSERKVGVCSRVR